MSKRKSKKRSRRRMISAKLGIILTALLAAAGAVSDWYVHHPRKWLDRHDESWPGFITGPLLWLGEPVGDCTDALGLTGHDAVYEYDEEAPSGEVLFAGAPVRTGLPAPSDIVIVDRGEFKIGWSNQLKHPVWCAYHVPVEARFDSGTRPNFTKDRAIAASPASGAYDKSGYDRGHMVPNYAIVTRFGEEMQKRTFLMSNIAPQSPQLNRGVWRDVEHRIADLYPARYGEIWVIVGCISDSGQTLGNSGVDVPSRFYQLVVAQEGLDIRAFAVLFDQEVPWRAWPTRHLISIDELEELTGLDFLPELPDFIQSPLESDLPSRLWPIRLRDIFAKLLLRSK